MSPEGVSVREEGEGHSMQMDQNRKKAREPTVESGEQLSLPWSGVHCLCGTLFIVDAIRREQTTCRAFKISAVTVCSDEVPNKKEEKLIKAKFGVRFCVCFTEVSKWSIRKKIWDHLEENDLVNFPRPCNNRIPNFVVSTRADQARGVGLFNSSVTCLLIIDGHFYSATNYSALQWCKNAALPIQI